MEKIYLENICEKNINQNINKVKKTLPFLSKFEKTKILGLRIQQLSSGAITSLTDEEQKDLKSQCEVAEKELKLGKLPLIVSRKLPNDKFEFWRVRDLIDLNS
tara:strand:+ start:2822 stop:3130 length:309 start_codon:yes stop_codon:yes gene_type:complete